MTEQILSADKNEFFFGGGGGYLRGHLCQRRKKVLQGIRHPRVDRLMLLLGGNTYGDFKLKHVYYSPQIQGISLNN